MTGKVLYLCLHPCSPGEAAATHVDNVVENLRRFGWQVSVKRVTPLRNVGLAGRVIRWLTAQTQAIAQLRAVDVVYVRSHPAAILTVAAAHLLRIPTVQEVNGPNEDYLMAWPAIRHAPFIVAGPIRWQLRAATRVVTVTDGLRAWVHERAGPIDARVVANGVDIGRFRPDAPVPYRASPYVVFVGALTSWQSVPLLVAAARHPNWPAEVTLVVAGDGVQRRLVTDAALELPGRVEWLGSVPHHEIPGLLAGGTAAIVTSQDRHGTGVSPLKLYEAMAAGVPIVLPEVAGAAATIRDDNCGIVVPARDPGALAGAVGLLYRDVHLRRQMGERGRQAAIEKHSWEHRARETARVLEEAMGSKSQTA